MYFFIFNNLEKVIIIHYHLLLKVCIKKILNLLIVKACLLKFPQNNKFNYLKL